MKSNLMVRDRQTSEHGTILQCLNDGWVRVLMESGQIRDYRPKELTGLIRAGRSDKIHSGNNSITDKKLLV